MADMEKVLNGLECCSNAMGEDCDNCPYKVEYDVCGIDYLQRDAIELLKEQEAIIEQYHKADTFLDSHGWKWDRN